MTFSQHSFDGRGRRGFRFRVLEGFLLLIALVIALACGSCSNGVPDGVGNDFRGTESISQGFAPGVALRGDDAIGTADSVGAVIPRGPRGGNLAVVLYAFDTARPSADFPQIAAKGGVRRGIAAAEPRDIFAAVLTKMSIRLDDIRGEQPTAFRQALVNTFRHERCTRCHGVHTDDPADSTFPNGTGHPVPFPRVQDSMGADVLNDLGNPITKNGGCANCHSPDLARADGVEDVVWFAPLAEQRFDFRNMSDEEIAASSRNFERLDVHLDVDSRITWAIESGRLPGRPGAPPNFAHSIPITHDQFSAQVNAWIAGGFQVDVDQATKALALASRTAAGGEGDADSISPRIAYVRNSSFDPGRPFNAADPRSFRAGQVFIAFASDATNLTAPAPAMRNVYRATLDLVVEGDGDLRLDPTGVELVSVASAGGAAGNGISDSPAISADGRFIAFASRATDLVDGFVDANGAGASDIFLRDLETGTTRLISRSRAAPDGVAQGGDGSSDEPASSAGGEVVAFSSEATDLIENDGNGVRDIFYVLTRDLAFGGTATSVRAGSAADVLRAAGLDPAGDAVFAGASAPAVFFEEDRGDRVSVVFEGRIDRPANAPPQHIYLFTSSSPNTVTLVSQAVDGNRTEIGNGDSSAPRFGPERDLVVFESRASNLDLVRPTDVNGKNDIFLVDLRQLSNVVNIKPQRLSIAPEGAASNAASRDAVLGEVGSKLFVTFLTGTPENGDLVPPPGQATIGNLGQSDQSDAVLVFLRGLETTGRASPLADRPVANTAPVCRIAATQVNGVPRTFTLDGSGSFDRDAGDAAVGFVWQVDGMEVEGQTVDFEFAALGEQTVVLRVTDSFGATSECSRTVTVENRPPTCDAVVFPATVHFGEEATFDASAAEDPDGDALTFAWDFGDGTQAAGEQVGRVYEAMGTFEVTLTVTDAEGAVSMCTGFIEVGDPPPPCPAGCDVVAPDLAARGEEVMFQAVGCGADDGSRTFAWDFGDGSPREEGLVATHTYDLGVNLTPMTFNARLIRTEGEDVCAVAHPILVSPNFDDLFPTVESKCGRCHIAPRPFVVSSVQATYDSMVATDGCGATKVIVPGNTDLTAHALAGRLRLDAVGGGTISCGGIMPIDGTPESPLSNAEKTLFRNWLLGGAPR